MQPSTTQANKFILKNIIFVNSSKSKEVNNATTYSNVVTKSYNNNMEALVLNL